MHADDDKIRAPRYACPRPRQKHIEIYRCRIVHYGGIVLTSETVKPAPPISAAN